MGFGCSQEASGQKPECHSIILDFNSSSNNHTEKIWAAGTAACLQSPPSAVVTHTLTGTPRALCMQEGVGSDSGDAEMVVWKENPHGGGRREREGEGSLVSFRGWSRMMS